jgi:hypothetical protein
MEISPGNALSRKENGGGMLDEAEASCDATPT